MIVDLVELGRSRGSGFKHHIASLGVLKTKSNCLAVEALSRFYHNFKLLIGIAPLLRSLIGLIFDSIFMTLLDNSPLLVFFEV
jgi:hypothetical protein